MKTALGGFVSFTGFIIIIMVILTATGVADIKNIIQSDIITGIIAFIGCLDLICGFLLVFSGKRFR